VKCSIKDSQSTAAKRPLDGKTVAIKDMIAIKDIPMTYGTASFQGYIPVSADFPQALWFIAYPDIGY
jgi:Asp-tRNA(Asn)/Glu-tRNA(Gln) amidotransferase A subunit family amidase